MSGDGGLRPKRVELLAFAVPALLTLRRVTPSTGS
jgi:hypothetical protein